MIEEYLVVLYQPCISTHVHAACADRKVAGRAIPREQTSFINKMVDHLPKS